MVQSLKNMIWGAQAAATEETKGEEGLGAAFTGKV